MSRDEGELRLLDDLPVGAEDDSFQHSLYADMLAAVFRSGKPGRCVGFFGKWGQGKSSVVRLLEEKLSDSTKVITFNPSGSDSPPLGAVLFGTPLDTPSACGGVVHCMEIVRRFDTASTPSPCPEFNRRRKGDTNHQLVRNANSCQAVTFRESTARDTL